MIYEWFLVREKDLIRIGPKLYKITHNSISMKNRGSILTHV